MRIFSMLLADGGTDWTMTIVMIAVLGLLVLYMFYSSRNRKKKAAEMVDRLKVGSKISTIGGVIGEVVELTDAEIVIKTGTEENSSVMRFMRQAVNYVFPDVSEGDNKDEEPVYNEIK